MNEDLEMVLVLILALFIFWFGMVFLLAGREIYGTDASLLWVSGILTLLGINGIGNFIGYLWSRNENSIKSNWEE